jgi:ABC-type nickel/cobalt efflux system permease component RcnA
MHSDSVFLIWFCVFMPLNIHGMNLLVQPNFSGKGQGKVIHEMRSGHGHHHHQCPDRADLKSLVITALAVGIVPCPSAVLILLFSLTLGIPAAGLWGMLCIAAGMAITTSLFAFGAIGFRKTFLSVVEGNDRMVVGLHGALSIGGALCISMLGLLLFIGTF